MPEGFQMHISSLLMQDSGCSFCIISDNALGVNNSEAMSTKVTARAVPTKATPRRIKSTGRSSQKSKRRNRSAMPKRHSSYEVTSVAADDCNMHVGTSNSRWSSIPQRQEDKSLQPPRRGLSEDSKEQLQQLASTRRPQNAPPTKPVRKVLDEEECSASFSSAVSIKSLPNYVRTDMSLEHCLAQNKKRGKGVRSIRRPMRGSEEKRRNIVDILDAALGSLDIDA